MVTEKKNFLKIGNRGKVDLTFPIDIKRPKCQIFTQSITIILSTTTAHLRYVVKFFIGVDIAFKFKPPPLFLQNENNREIPPAPPKHGGGFLRNFPYYFIFFVFVKLPLLHSVLI